MLKLAFPIALFILSGKFLTAAEKPNVIIVFADDMGIDSVQAYNPTFQAPTPHLDQLSRDAESFMDAHTPSSVCSPTRYALLTGRYPWRGVLKNGVLRPYESSAIEKERLTLPKILKGLGYDTACIGKWHLGWDWPFKSDEPQLRPKSDRATPEESLVDWQRAMQPGGIGGGPLGAGFDTYFGSGMPNFPPYTWHENDHILETPTKFKPFRMPERNNDYTGAAGLMVPDWNFEKDLPVITQKSIAYIKEKAVEERPFFLYFSLTSPHSPIVPDAEFIGKGQVPGSVYADWIYQTDWVLGQVEQAIKDAGIRDNTILIFSTDNGTEISFAKKNWPDSAATFNYSVRGKKRELYEGGHRVPFMIRWPGLTKAGKRRSEVICVSDIMATLADYFSVEFPDNSAEDSVSFLPALRGESFERAPVVHCSIEGQLGIRKGDWKLIQMKKGFELYNLKADPKETENLYSSHPEIAEDMRNIVERYIKEGRSTAGAAQPIEENKILSAWLK